MLSRRVVDCRNACGIGSLQRSELQGSEHFKIVNLARAVALSRELGAEMGLFNRTRSSDAVAGLLVTPIWGQGWENFDIVGESHYGDAIRGLLPKNLGEAGDETHVQVMLVPEPENKYDRNAIAVRAETGTVGYLPKEDAATYAPVLAALKSNGRVAQTSARIWGCTRKDRRAAYPQDVSRHASRSGISGAARSRHLRPCPC